MSDSTKEDKLTNMINDMKDRGSKEQEIHEIITRMIQAVIREKPEDPLDFMISFIDTC